MLKRKKSVLDEREMLEMYRIEHAGLWLMYALLSAAIIVQLLLDAEKRGIPTENGLLMLVAQAKEAAQWFTNEAIDNTVISSIHRILKQQMENIILIGMPGCGRTDRPKICRCGRSSGAECRMQHPRDLCSRWRSCISGSGNANPCGAW